MKMTDCGSDVEFKNEKNCAYDENAIDVKDAVQVHLHFCITFCDTQLCCKCLESMTR